MNLPVEWQCQYEISIWYVRSRVNILDLQRFSLAKCNLLTSIFHEFEVAVPLEEGEPFHFPTRVHPLTPRVQNMAHSHSHENGASHSHDNPAADHGHTHEILDGPGSYMGREMPIIEGRNWSERAFTVGIGGYVLYN